jgi:hypothetical protein
VRQAAAAASLAPPKRQSGMGCVIIAIIVAAMALVGVVASLLRSGS